MEVIQQNRTLELEPNAIYEIRKLYNLHQPGDIEIILDSFEDWINKQDHFLKKDFPRHYLETTLIASKGSLERAKRSLDKLCTSKTLMAEFFNLYDVKKLADFTFFTVPAIMPKQTKEYYRVHIAKLLSSDFESSLFFDYFKFHLLIIEYIKLHDYFKGFHLVIDCRDVNIVSYAMKLNVIQLRQLMSILLEGHSVSIKGIHIISISKAINVLVAIIKQVVSSKISDRIWIYSNVEELHECIPKEILPEEYGGDEKPLKALYDDWYEVLAQKKTVQSLKVMFERGTDEANRQADNYNNHILGMPGSFRSLIVD